MKFNTACLTQDTEIQFRNNADKTFTISGRKSTVCCIHTLLYKLTQ